MAALGLLSIAAFLQLASLLRDLTRLKRALILIKTVKIISISSLHFRHDTAVDKDGVEYIIIDL